MSARDEASGIHYAELTDSIHTDFGIALVKSGCTLAEAQCIHAALLTMQTGLDGITGGHGRDWIFKNLVGARIVVGTRRDLFGLPVGRPHTIGSTVYLLTNFEHYRYEMPEYRVDVMLMHELAHVWDNRSAHGLGTLFGGGYGDALMKWMGCKSTALLGLRFLDHSLHIPPGNRFINEQGFGYGNNSPADYFAHTFAAALATPCHPNLPPRAEAWMVELIDRTKL
jgi:hypothetical protein